MKHLTDNVTLSSKAYQWVMSRQSSDVIFDQLCVGGKGGVVGPAHNKKRWAPARVKAM